MTSSYSIEPGRPLTPRMRDVLAGAELGETRLETAARLGVSLETVKTIRAAARDRVQADACEPLGDAA